ncbi:PTS system, beta-glucoside-specific IIA component [Enterococcus sp. AZ135]|uniref:glucose PTS transporter subunit IIA n=1 Tax=unclassified Enterococcus TaxID=2608891 RepID=UPI003F22FDAA
MDNRELAKAILSNVGGEKNISHFTNCVTRLRFQLKDDMKVNQQEISRLDGVLGVQFQGDQFQVILGGRVASVANELNEITSLTGSDDENNGEIGVSSVLNTLSSILTPALPPVIAGGLLKGFIFMFINFGWADGGTDTIIFLNGLSDAMFYFFPFLLAVSSAKRFKTNEYLALTLAGLMMYPFAIAEGQQVMKLFGFIPIAVVDYSASVLPIIFSVWLLKYVKRFFDKYIPDMVNMVFSPLLSLLIVAPIAMSVLAPLGYYIGEYIAHGIKWLIDFSPWLAGLVVGSTRPILVLGGMHHAMNPLVQQEISSFGSSQMLAMMLMSTFAQATAPLVVYFRAKQAKEKQVALSAVIPGYLGITEPSIYGVLVKYKGAMIATCLGGGIGAAVSTMLGGQSFGFVMPGILSLPAFMGEGFIGIIVGMIISIVSTAILTFLLMNRFSEGEKDVQKDSLEETTSSQVQEGSLSIHSPVKGNLLSLESIDDNTFSQEILGKTLAIDVPDGKVYAPFEGKVKAVFPTNHAIGLEASNGVELLIHIGLDTVTLDGEGFELKVKQGQEINRGDELLTFDPSFIKSKHLNDAVIVVITNSEKYKTINKAASEMIDLDGSLFNIATN